MEHWRSLLYGHARVISMRDGKTKSQPQSVPTVGDCEAPKSQRCGARVDRQGNIGSDLAGEQDPSLRILSPAFTTKRWMLSAVCCRAPDFGRGPANTGAKLPRTVGSRWPVPHGVEGQACRVKLRPSPPVELAAQRIVTGVSAHVRAAREHHFHFRHNQSGGGALLVHGLGCAPSMHAD